MPQLDARAKTAPTPVAQLEERIRAARTVWDNLPRPGCGATTARHRALVELGRADLSLARIAEGHTDAVAILAEAGRDRREHALYGVWASEAARAPVIAQRTANGDWQLDGLKAYCSGATFAAAALVTARAGDATLLFDVALDQDGVRTGESDWATPALADTATGPVRFNRVRVACERLVGDDGWYLKRPGFWHGAIGPAACWAGGAASLVDAATRSLRRDAHSRAHVGAMQAISWGMSALLDQAAGEIDADPEDRRAEARVRALKVRHLIERWCTEILDRFGRATGPQLLACDHQIARQHMALNLYIRQCHAERDLETIPA
jgi:alkylation response protein AidB-like acyl-CoA dehydrogenase